MHEEIANISDGRNQSVKKVATAGSKSQYSVKKTTAALDGPHPKKITTPYPHKYKTVMCKFFNRGDTCPYGDECNYAHGSV